MKAAVLRRCAVLALVAVLAIGNSAGIQAIAWMGMIAQRIQSEPVSTAIASTLNGSRPCPLCRIATALAAAESATLLHESAGKNMPGKLHAAPALKWQLDEPWMLPLDPAAVQALPWPTVDLVADGLTRTPPTPPPRA